MFFISCTKTYILNNSVEKSSGCGFVLLKRIKIAFSDAACTLFWSSDSLQSFFLTFFKLKKKRCF